MDLHNKTASNLQRLSSALIYKFNYECSCREEDQYVLRFVANCFHFRGPAPAKKLNVNFQLPSPTSGDIIAANKQPKKAAAPKKKVAAKPAPTTNVNIYFSPSANLISIRIFADICFLILQAGKNKRTKKGGNGTVPALVKVTKAAKSVGVAQAKRAATTAQVQILLTNYCYTFRATKRVQIVFQKCMAPFSKR